MHTITLLRANNLWQIRAQPPSTNEPTTDLSLTPVLLPTQQEHRGKITSLHDRPAIDLIVALDDVIRSLLAISTLRLSGEFDLEDAIQAVWGTDWCSGAADLDLDWFRAGACWDLTAVEDGDYAGGLLGGEEEFKLDFYCWVKGWFGWWTYVECVFGECAFTSFGEWDACAR